MTMLKKALKCYIYLPYRLVFLVMENSTLIIEFSLVEVLGNKEVVVVDRHGIKHAFSVEQVVLITSVE